MQTRARKRRLDHDTATALASTDAMVRTETMQSLRFLPTAELASHAGAIADVIFGMLADSDTQVRYDALRLLHYDDFIGVLASDMLALVCSAVANMLTDAGDNGLVTRTLCKLKRKRARLHWATARVYRARPYARFWYDYVGEQLCAPGGVWAERDRAAFEEEFI